MSPTRTLEFSKRRNSLLCRKLVLQRVQVWEKSCGNDLLQGESAFSVTGHKAASWQYTRLCPANYQCLFAGTLALKPEAVGPNITNASTEMTYHLFAFTVDVCLHPSLCLFWEAPVLIVAGKACRQPSRDSFVQPAFCRRIAAC